MVKLFPKPTGTGNTAGMIRLSNIYKSYENNDSYIIKNISLEIQHGETFGLLGSSGSGKTTLLKMMNRLIEPSKGLIEINNKDIRQYKPETLRHSIGYVFQQIGLFPHMTVEKNIAIVLQLMHRPLKERLARAHELLDLTGLDPSIYAKRFPNELSGGQSQRVGVARALAADPDILLMDEPFGALDAITRNGLQETMLDLKKQMHKTIVFVTHDIIEAFRLADRIAVMHQGCLQQVGTKSEILHHPESDFVRHLIASSTLKQE